MHALALSNIVKSDFSSCTVAVALTSTLVRVRSTCCDLLRRKIEEQSRRDSSMGLKDSSGGKCPA
jgi:hypothetical protein